MFPRSCLTERRQLDSDLNESIRLDPTSACALTNRGRVYAFKRDLDRAIADYRKALETSPGLHTASESLQRLGAAQ